MKNSALLVSAALAGALMAFPAQAQESANGDRFVLSAVGERSWRVECEFRQDDGDEIALRERGRGLLHAEDLVLGDVLDASCRYQVPERGSLQLTFDMGRTGFTCPFGASSDGMCQIQLSGGEVGAFEVHVDPVLREARIHPN